MTMKGATFRTLFFSESLGVRTLRTYAKSLSIFYVPGTKLKVPLSNHHVYFTAQRWLSDNEILCRVTGYGDADPEGFTKHYVYKIGGVLASSVNLLLG